MENKTDSLIKANNDVNFIKQLEEAEKIADYIAGSATFAKPFEEKVIDPVSNELVEIKVNKNDIIAAILLGNSIGLKPMEAIILGKKLNANSYFSVLKGKSLGLDAVSSLSQISVIGTGNGDVYHTGVQTITKCMLDAGCTFEYTEDYVPVYKYIDTKSNVGYDEYDAETMFEVTSSTKAAELQVAMTAGKKTVRRTLVDRRTTIVVNRPEKNIKDLTISYTLQQATDAGLYKGYHSEDKDEQGKPLYVKGKANWNNHPATMLRNRPTSIAGRIAVADKLNSIYLYDEIEEIVKQPITVDADGTVIESNTSVQE